MSETISGEFRTNNQSLYNFKQKVNELLEITKGIPKECIPEARTYFYQHVDILRNILESSQECEAIEASCHVENTSLDTIPVEGNRTSRKTADEVNRFQNCGQTEDSFTVIAEISKSCEGQTFDSDKSGCKAANTDDECSDLEEDECIKGTVIENTGVQLQSEENAFEKLIQNLHDENSQSMETAGDEADAPNSLPEPPVELADITSVGHEMKQSEASMASKPTTDVNDQESVCDIAKLLECIPGLSNYMQVDPKNVTVLKDSEDNADNCLHLMVELDDGTVQEFKIASDAQKTDEKTVYDAHSEGRVESEENKNEQKQPLLDETDAEVGPSIMSRRLRTRKKKPEVRRKGPGRPKNENIPEPEISEKGEACYRCTECEATVKTYHALLVHTRIHTGSRPFQCSMCNKSFTTKGNMKAHELTTHSENKPWKCEYCNRCFKEKKVLKIHERTHTGEKPYSCSICERSFSQKSVMLEHMHVHSDHKPHLCDFCGQGFRALSSLKAHKKRHLGLREFQCESCNKAFVCRNELTRHLLSHTRERPYSCEMCSKAFTRLSYLNEHMNLHFGMKPFKCEECPASFSDTMSLHRHKKIHQLRFSERTLPENEPITAVNAICDNTHDASMRTESLTFEIPEEASFNVGQSIQLVVDENTSAEDFQKLQSLLLSATSNAEFMMNSKDNSNQLYQVLCVNPDTQEVVGQVEGHEIIVEGQTEDISSLNLQYSIH